MLANEPRVVAHGPTNRNIPNLLRNLKLAWRLVREHRPDAILSTGAGLALPFFIAGKRFGCRLVYVESVTRVLSLSLTGRLIYPLADEFFVQWPQLAHTQRARYAGSVL